MLRSVGRLLAYRGIGWLFVTWLCIAAIPISADTTPQAELDAEGFDHYTLALTWHAGFCETRREPPRECREASLREGAAQGFVLHGLWPSLPERFAERGVTRQRWWSQGCFLDEPRADGSFCRAHAPFDFPEPFDDRLDNAMPGRASCLDRYEYAKHAACLALPAEAYFSTALELLEAVNASAFVDFLMIHQGDEVTRNALIDAFEAAFGDGTGRALSLKCGGRGNRVLTEVRIGIDAEQVEDFPDSASLTALRRGRCATRVHLVAAQ
ncbi:ribonuclease I [Modicisalibacter muralis]|uniref:Ribonuclease I n=1 Tax=Modicisalibacter muralis TaxID=119000 RepID=A0A1G9QZT5_9GAMM|nr:ribonuclease I [Halomonas muralis]SDM16494.1 ribonuclease I [Halomonas muralis]